MEEIKQNKKRQKKDLRLIKKENINKLNPMQVPVINEQIKMPGHSLAIFS